MKKQPENWPANGPAYHSKEGWEFEKKIAEEKLRTLLTLQRLTITHKLPKVTTREQAIAIYGDPEKDIHFTQCIGAAEEMVKEFAKQKLFFH